MKKRNPHFLVPERVKTFSPDRQTIEKALIWLREEKEELAGHITDVNLVVKLYLKDQERKREKISPLQKSPLCTDSLCENEQTKTTYFPIEMDRMQSKDSFSLDEKSRQAVKRAQSQLNIPEEAALKVLIQLGCRTLQTLFK